MSYLCPLCQFIGTNGNNNSKRLESSSVENLKQPSEIIGAYRLDFRFDYLRVVMEIFANFAIIRSFDAKSQRYSNYLSSNQFNDFDSPTTVANLTNAARYARA